MKAVRFGFNMMFRFSLLSYCEEKLLALSAVCSVCQSCSHFLSHFSTISVIIVHFGFWLYDNFILNMVSYIKGGIQAKGI